MNPADDQTMVEQLNTTALAFRSGQEGIANSALTCMIDCLSKVLPQLQPTTVQQMAPLLEDILAAVARKDFSWAADLLEYKLLILIVEQP